MSWLFGWMDTFTYKRSSLPRLDLEPELEISKGISCHLAQHTIYYIILYSYVVDYRLS